MTKRLILSVVFLLLVFCIYASATRAVYQKVVCLAPNNAVDFVTNTGVTTSANYTLNAWMVERPSEVLTTASGQPGYVSPTNLRIVKLGNGTTVPYYASILVQLGQFPTQWVAGEHLHYQVIYIPTGETTEFDITIPIGSTTVNILDPTQVIPPSPPSAVEISSDPSGADVIINGSSVGSTPYFTSINYGESFTVSVNLPGYTFTPLEQLVSYLPTPQSFSFSGTPELLPQTFEVFSVPSGAEVYLSGSWVGTTPYYSMINPGESFEVTVSLSGWTFSPQLVSYEPLVPVSLLFNGTEVCYNVSGSISWAYNQTAAANLSIILSDHWGQIASQVTTTNELGEYLFENVIAGDYHLTINQQNIDVNGEPLVVAASDTQLNVSGDTSLDLSIQVESNFSTYNCTFIGRYQGHEYWRSNWADYWIYTRDNFSSMGGYLVSINSEGESQFISQYIVQNPSNYLLGLEWNGSSWNWMDGTPLTYTNWAEGEPSINWSCGYISSSGTWHSTGYWDHYALGIMELDGYTMPYIPKAITNFTIQQQRDYPLSLSWTNPGEVVCGFSLNPNFQIIIKRGAEIVATLENCLPGQAMNWTDSVPTGQQHYQIYAVNEYGNSEIVSQEILFGDAEISGNVTMAYNDSPVSNLAVKLYDATGTNVLQTSITDNLGSYSFSDLIFIDYRIKIANQNVFVDGDSINIAAVDSLIAVRDDVTMNLTLAHSIPPLNTSSCTYIGTYGGHEYWRSNWATYWHYLNDDFTNRGGHHVTISSFGESQFINQYILQDGGAFHLGYTYNGSSWSWVDGSSIGYTNWSPGNPDGNSQVSRIYNDGSGHVYWDDVNHWEVYYCGILESYGQETYLKPKQVSDFTIQQQRDFTININWTNPTEVTCGLSLNSGFQVAIKRNGEVVQTLNNCIPGQAMSWQDFVLTGRHTYSICAINEYGNSDSVSQSVSYGNQVQGVARLNNLADHSGIKVKFIADPDTPAAVSDSTYTSASGFYSINLTIGRYTIIYSKAGYLDQTYNNYLHSEPTDLPEQTLEYVGTIMFLSGSLSGTLSADYAYIINSQIWVDSGNSLTLEPGVRFYFKNGIGFDVNGTLSAIGTVQNPILFTSVTSETRGEFWLNGSGSLMERCEFTKGTWAFRLNSNSHVSNSKFYGNNIGVGIMDSAGEGCLFDYNEIYNNTEHAMLLYCYGAVIEHNEIHNNALTGHILHKGENRAAQFTNNYIHHNSSSNILIYLYYSNWFNFSNNRVENNTSSSWLYYDEWQQITFNNNIIQNNQCDNLIMFRGYNGVINNNFIYNNNGSFHIQGDNQTAMKNTLIGNTGTGIAVWGGSNQKIHQNTVVGSGGIGMDVYDSPTIRDNLVAFNGGTELRNNSSNNNLYYNLFYDTSGTLLENGGGLPFLLDMQATNANGTACDSYFNISADPLFFDFANENFNLLATSPCINAGDPTSTLDPDGTIADLGAYYYDLNASSHPQIAIPLSLYNFQALPVGESVIWNCPVRNTGTDPLLISSIQLNNPAFYLATRTRTNLPFTLSIAPNETGYIPIGFSPSAVTDYADTLSIFSNALMNPEVSIRIFGSGALSSSVSMAMPQNTTVNVLSSFTLPLTVSDTTPYNILSYNMSLTFDPAIFEFVNMETTGTISEDWFVQVNSAGTGVLHIGGAGTNPLSGSGDLFKLNFRTLSGIADGTESYINISQVVFNEGGITVQGCFASVLIRNIIYGDIDDNLAIQAYDAALTLQYSVMMDPLPVADPRPWLDWRMLRADVSGDGNIFAYDASIILQRVVGIIDQFPVELDRLAAPESVVEISFYNNQLNLSSPDFSSLYGLNLMVNNPNGLPFGAVQLSEAFQDALMNQYSDENAWYMALATITPPEGSGTICTIPLEILSETQLSISMVINESNQDYVIGCSPLELPEPPALSINFLAPNSPNPFNPSTTIHYGLKESSNVELEIYNLKGQKVKTLVIGAKPSGNHSIIWNGKDDCDKPVSSGIYFSRIRIGNNWTKTQKMMLMK